MVQVNNVTTENTYKPQAAQGGQEASAPNSIYTVQQPQNSGVEENKNTSKLDQLLEKLCAELSKYGLNPQELKNSGILYRISGMNAQQLENVSEKELQQVVDCLKSAIKDSASDDKVDLDKVGKLANDYYTAVKTGWTIEGFKKHNNAVKKSTLFERLKETGCIDKNADINTIKPEELASAIDKFFNETLLSQLKNAKTQKAKEQIYKAQLQTFGRLLINTPDDQKAIFKQAITSLVASNRVKGLEAVLQSFDTQSARTEWADSWSVEDSKRLATKADVEGNVPTQEDVTASTAIVTQHKSEEGIKEHHEAFQADAKVFFEQNKDALAKIAEKEAKGEELTAEEKQLKLQRDNFYTAVAAGEISGTAINEVISAQAKEQILGTMNKDAYELPTYKEIVKQVTEFVEKHPEALTVSKEELVKVLDKATNGNYSTVASGSDAELKAPVTAEKSGVETIVNKKSENEFLQAQQKQQQLMAQIKTNSNEQPVRFTVEREEAVRTTDDGSLKAKLSTMNNQDKLSYITTNFYKFSFGVKNSIASGLKQLGHQKLMQVLPQINSDSFILGIYKNLNLEAEDVKKLNVSQAAKNIMLNSIQKQEA